MMFSLRRQYPDQWEQLSTACKEKAGWTCEHCGARQHEIRTSKKGNPYFIYLHAAHKNHDKRNPDPVLICLCVSCHARYDYEHREREARARLECLKHLKLLIERGAVTARVFEA
jgi:ssDNA-binding Zn-finger/Zn-ribbon topoisomerase 1